MGQPKTNTLCFDNGYAMSYINYCYETHNNNDTSDFTINKIAALTRQSNGSLELLKLFYSFNVKGQNYYVRPYRIKVTGNYVIVPYVDTDEQGIPTENSTISMAAFDLNNKQQYMPQPSMLFKTNVRYDNYSSIVFNVTNDTLYIFDNLNKILSVYNLQKKITEKKYSDLGIRFLYDITRNESGFEMLCIKENNESWTFRLTTTDITQLRLVEGRKIANEYLNFAAFDNLKVTGYKINKNKIYYSSISKLLFYEKSNLCREMLLIHIQRQNKYLQSQSRP